MLKEVVSAFALVIVAVNLILYIGIARASEQKHAAAPSMITGRGQPTVELNTILMESTFRFEGRDSLGTAFMIGRPYPQEPTKTRAVLVTAAHVLEGMKGDSATLVMRRKVEVARWQRLPVRIQIRAGERPLWTKHPQADVAVIYVNVPQGVIKDLIPMTLLADDKTLAEFQVHPGDELNCLGSELL